MNRRKLIPDGIKGLILLVSWGVSLAFNQSPWTSESTDQAYRGIKARFLSANPNKGPWILRNWRPLGWGGHDPAAHDSGYRKGTRAGGLGAV